MIESVAMLVFACVIAAIALWALHEKKPKTKQ